MAWTTPRTWVASEVVTASLLNTHLRDNFAAIGDAWPSWTPSLFNWTLGNGTLTGEAIQAGKLIIGTLTLTTGSTTAYSTTLAFNLPATMADTTANVPIGTMLCVDTSASSAPFYRRLTSSTSGTRINGRGDDGTAVSATVPFTFASGDVVKCSFCYEAA